jgi:hypothetical protein
MAVVADGADDDGVADAFGEQRHAPGQTGSAADGLDDERAGTGKRVAHPRPHDRLDQ